MMDGHIWMTNDLTDGRLNWSTLVQFILQSSVRRHFLLTFDAWRSSIFIYDVSGGWCLSQLGFVSFLNSSKARPRDVRLSARGRRLRPISTMFPSDTSTFCGRVESVVDITSRSSDTGDNTPCQRTEEFQTASRCPPRQENSPTSSTTRLQVPPLRNLLKAVYHF